MTTTEGATGAPVWYRMIPPSGQYIHFRQFANGKMLKTGIPLTDYKGWTMEPVAIVAKAEYDSLTAEVQRLREGYEQPAPEPLVMPPDWSQAPEWAEWWAMDANGESCWYKVEPHTTGDMWSNQTGTNYKYCGRKVDDNWRATLQRRPAAGGGE